MTIIIGDKPIFGDYKILISNVTFERFLEFSTEDLSCELMDGVLIINSPAAYQHETIFRFLLTYLDQLGLKYNVGRALGSRFVVKLDEKWGLEPDILFIRPENEKKIKSTYFEGAPDLVVEILSPSTRKDDLTKKLSKYQQFYVPEVWIVDPEEKTLTIFTPDGQKAKYYSGHSDVRSITIPEIRLNLLWLWDETLNPIQCMKTLDD